MVERHKTNHFYCLSFFSHAQGVKIGINYNFQYENILLLLFIDGLSLLFQCYSHSAFKYVFIDEPPSKIKRTDRSLEREHQARGHEGNINV